MSGSASALAVAGLARRAHFQGLRRQKLSHCNSQAPPLFFGGRAGLDEAAARTKANRIANEQESTEAGYSDARPVFSRNEGVLGSYDDS